MRENLRRIRIIWGQLWMYMRTGSESPEEISLIMGRNRFTCLSLLISPNSRVSNFHVFPCSYSHTQKVPYFMDLSQEGTGYLSLSQ
jgi:hypothetical protein